MSTLQLLEKFYGTLFAPSEDVCWSKTPYGTNSFGVTLFPQFLTHQFFTINPLSGARKDDNVSCYRNILLEFDNVSLNEQRAILTEVPHTTRTFSGGKSLHAIISLQTPCSTKDEYDKLVRRIYDRLPDVDKSTKNPSRFSRTPGCIRDNGIEQTLEFVGQQVSAESLEAWLGPDTVEEFDNNTVPTPARCLKLLSPHTLYFLGFGAEPGQWNRSLYLSALDMARCGRSEFEVVKQLTEVTGKLDASDRRTIRSALNTVRKEL